ncbi:centrosomal protein of 112 kDa-like isoform X2 [Gigantopelta aegis]|uniref:centrosomal protein of 112 kDa-like isoform X2 n=1 Tax=Gigantopelta aegis TaxID=1735272 RepID=UPI001B88ADC6|nr:centrosomal protein of 112 kDa-like isoform X2 [Gigantopelta aegis]
MDGQDSYQELDQEFDKILADMKPHVLKLPQKSDRQRCAVWIKKLCEPPASGIIGRKNRNMYTQLMLHMLKRGSLEGPFDKKPDEGPLPTLPPYMSIYFDESVDTKRSRTFDDDKVPDWVNGELMESVGSSVFLRSTLDRPAASSTWLSSSSGHQVKQRPHSSMGLSLDKEPSFSPPRRTYLPREEKTVGFSMTEDSDWSKPYTSTLSASQSLPRGTTFQEDVIGQTTDREIEMRAKMIEAKYHEEKLKLQQKHDTAVQKILDRKNAEIEDVKSHYRGKASDLEETVTKLERKIHSLVKESQVLRETKDKQVTELKKLIDETNISRKAEFDKKLHDAHSEFEKEKFEMQKQHTKNIQEILDDTNSRLQRMEREYVQQTESTASVIKELESRVQQLTEEVDKTIQQKVSLEEQVITMETRSSQLNEEVNDLRDRLLQEERDHQTTLAGHEHEMRTLKHKTEASLEFLKQEQTMSAAKAMDTIEDLQQQVEHTKKLLKDTEEQRQRQMRELEQVHQQDKLHLENLHDKEIHSMKKELEQLDQDSQKKIKRLEQLILEKEKENTKLQEQIHAQAVQSEKALQEFKAQVEKNQIKVYDDMKKQMDQVESDLNKSKQLREKQCKEFSRQLDEQAYKHDRELQELKQRYENEKSQLLRDFHVQKEYMIQEHERDLDVLKEMNRKEMQELETRLSSRHEKDSKTISELEAQVRELREELVQSNQLRKQQLVELGLLREEEKQKMQRDHEAEVLRLRSELEQQRLELQKTHSTEMETMLEKTNHRLKDIEREYSERGQKSAETTAELHATINQLRDEKKRLQESKDKMIADVNSQNEEVRKSLKKQYSSTLTSLQKELDNHRQRTRNLERQLQKEESEHEAKMTRLKLSYEDRLRGLIPVEVRQELEDTIESLKSQVNSLQQRAAVLQEELDLRIMNTLAPFGSRTSSPIKSSV